MCSQLLWKVLCEEPSYIHDPNKKSWRPLTHCGMCVAETDAHDDMTEEELTEQGETQQHISDERDTEIAALRQHNAELEESILDLKCNIEAYEWAVQERWCELEEQERDLRALRRRVRQLRRAMNSLLGIVCRGTAARC